MIAPQATKKNVIFIEDVKEEWKNEKSTGLMIRDGYKHGASLAQLELEFKRDYTVIDAAEGELGFRAEVKSASTGADQVGFVFEDDQIDFRTIAETLLPGVPEKAWK